MKNVSKQMLDDASSSSLKKIRKNNVKGKSEKQLAHKLTVRASRRIEKRLLSTNDVSDAEQSDCKDDMSASKIEQLIEAAKKIDNKSSKSKRRLNPDNEKLSDAPSEKKKKVKNRSTDHSQDNLEKNTDGTIYQALGADDLNDEGKKELDGIMEDFDPKLVRGLLSRLAKLEKYRGNKDNEESGSNASQYENPQLKSDDEEEVKWDKKEQIKSDEKGPELNSKSPMSSVLPLNQPYEHPLMFPLAYQNPLLMQMYYTQFMMSQYPGSLPYSPYPNNLNLDAGNTTSMPAASSTITRKTNEAEKFDDKAVTQSTDKFELSRTSQVHENSLPFKPPVSGTIAVDKSLEGQPAEKIIKESFGFSKQVSLPYAVPGVTENSANSSSPEATTEQEGIDKYENSDISEKVSHAVEDTTDKRSKGDKSADNDVVRNDDDNEVAGSSDHNDVIRNSDDNDSNMSTEFHVQDENKVKEEDLPESLNKFLPKIHTDSTSPRPSFLRFVDDINDPLKSSIVVTDVEAAATDFITSKVETLQSSVITSSVVKPIENQKSKNKEVITISDEEENSDIIDEKSYHTLSAVNKKKMPVETGSDKTSIVEFLAHLPPNIKTMLSNGTTTLSNVLTSAIKSLQGQHPAHTAMEINASLQSLLNSTKTGESAKTIIESDRQSTSSGASSTKMPKLIKSGHVSDPKDFVDHKTWYSESSRNMYLQDEDGDTILHIAIAKENVNLSTDIIKRMKGFHMDIMNTLGQTPLHMALYVHKVEIIRALLHHGADVGILDGHGNSVLHIACEENSQVMVDCLLEFSNTSREICETYKQMTRAKNNQGLAAIHIAIQKRNLGIIDHLIKFGSDLDVQEEKSGATALVMASQKSDWDLAKIFIHAGASVNIPTYSGYYPLHYAVQAVNMEMVKILIARQAEIGSKSAECPDTGKTSREIKRLLDKEMRKRRRKRHQESLRKSP